MEKMRLEGRSKPAPHNEEKFMDCIVRDVNYSGVDVEFDKGYKRGNEAKKLKREAADRVEEAHEMREKKRYKGEMKRGKMPRSEMQEY